MIPSPIPLIGLTACMRDIGAHPFHVVGDKYMRAVLEGSGGLPVAIPAFGSLITDTPLLEQLDGLLLTGSQSNVHPRNYGGLPSPESTFHDPQRDATTLPLIRDAIERGVPVLCICRGAQELNVALGGTLHQELHAIPGRLDHREDKTAPRDVQYEASHNISLTKNGFLASLWPERTIAVNSLHSQGIDCLAPTLTIEAVASDGQIEAVRVVDAPSLALGIQWHPEWKFRDSTFSTSIFQAFGDAARARAKSKISAGSSVSCISDAQPKIKTRWL